MRSRTTTWKSIAASGDFSMNVKVSIGGTEYTSLTSMPVINSDLATEPFSAGNCFAAEMQFGLRTTDTIAKGAEVTLYIQLATASSVSEWKSAGTFYISKRAYKNGVYDFKCYDKLMRANQPYVVDPTASDARVGWPKTMQECVSYIATALGATVDSRTVIQTGDAYMVPFPETKTMFDMLAHIAGCHGGNFILTPDNTLRLVRSTYNTSGNALSTDTNLVNIPVIIGEYTTGESATISRVTMTIDNDTGYTHGNDTGAELKILENPYASQQACDDIYEQVAGTTYVPFNAGSACFDPMAELGDWTSVGGVVQGVIYNMSAVYGRMFRATVSAPTIYEAEDEYPYTSPLARLSENIGKQFENVINDYSSRLEQTRKDILMEVSATYGKYDTSGLTYTIAIVGYGYPSDEGYAAEEYAGEYYLNQTSGAVYRAVLQDGEYAWSYIETLKLITESIRSRLQQQVDALNIEFSQSVASLQTSIGSVDGKLTEYSNDLQEQYTELTKRFSFTQSGLVISASDSGLSLVLDNDRLGFIQGGLEVAYMSDRTLYITDANFLNSLQLGNFAFKPRANGNLSFVKVGE